MNNERINGKPLGLNIVYVNGIPKVFNSKGEEIREVIDLVLHFERETFNTVHLKALCNVYGTVEEMRHELGLNDTN